MRYPKPLPKYIRLSYLGIIIIGILIVLASFNTSTNQSLKQFGLLSLTLLLVFSLYVLIYYLLKTYKIPRSMGNLIIIAFLLLLTYSIALIIDGFSARGLTVFIQLILILAFFICMCFIKWNDIKISVLANIIALFIMLNFLIFVTSGFPFPFKSFTGNVNVFAALMFFTAFFPLLNFLLTKRKLKRFFWFFIILINLILIIVGQARAIWLALLIGFLVFVLWERILTKNKLIFYSLFWVVIFVIITVTILYPLASTHPDAAIWNQFIKEYTGANLFSGRDRFWLLLIEVILQKPIIGYGASAVPSHFIPIGLSSHNLYIQIALQVGLLGLGLVWLLLLNIWKIFYFGKKSIYVRLAGSFFIAMLIYQIFEVSLTQNNLAVGLVIWLVMAIGVNKSLEERRRDLLKLGEKA